MQAGTHTAKLQQLLQLLQERYWVGEQWQGGESWLWKTRLHDSCCALSAGNAFRSRHKPVIPGCIAAFKDVAEAVDLPVSRVGREWLEGNQKHQKQV